MREFTWCRQEIAEECRRHDEHVHIVITTPGYRRIMLSCRKTTLRLFFHDLDPETIRHTETFATNPAKGQALIDGCFTETHAREVASFVVMTNPDHVVVNCEAGISRSAGVVLALRRKYGGDTEELYKKAHPNIHVACMLGRELGVGPFEEPKYDKYEGIVNLFEDSHEREQG